MKISLNWLKNYIDFSLGSSTVAEYLTQRGLEVTAIRPTIQGALEGLIIGEVVECVPHPNADRLKKTIVDIGLAEPLTIICGAPNVTAGLKVVVAPVGTTIYNTLNQTPLHITKRKIRGEWSEGMLCAASEIGLQRAATEEGILLVDTTPSAGTAARDYFKEEVDEILEIDITPNRADACSHLGVARELKAILHLPLHLPTVDAFASTVTGLPPITIRSIDQTSCPRYCGLIVKHVTIDASPAWLRNKLVHIGIKSINNVVDITNYILHELGQPIHAFDYDSIVHKTINVKPLPAGTLFMGLDGVERKLAGHEPMVCDGATPIAMAGILGGLHTSVTAKTQHLFIESAYFNPAIIRSAVQYHHLHTEASFRFERGSDPTMPLYALKRAALLLQKLIPSAILGAIVEFYPTPISHCTIPLSYQQLQQCLGFPIAPATIKQIIRDLEITIEAETTEGFTAKVPPYRVDVTREIDLIAEIARIYGYSSFLPTTHLSTTYIAPLTATNYAYKIEQEISKLLVAQGYYEIWTNSLLKEAYLADQEAITLLNPLSSSASILRPTLLFSGLEVIAYNLAHRQQDIKLFEFGTIYSQENGQYKEEKKLGIWLTGQIEPKNWVRQLGPVTLLTLRTTLEQLAQKLGGIVLSYASITHPFYVQAVQATHQGVPLLLFGEVSPTMLAKFPIKQPVFFAAICWKKLLAISQLHKLYEPIAKVPTVTRDLSLLIDHAVLFQEIQHLILKQGHTEIKSIALFDVYEGPPLPTDKKAYALSLTLQDREQTLADARIDQIMHQIIQCLERDLHAIIRK
ncbi:MAG: phenylalanine--tRNA ligase subunit beta [Candidatus Cardinium sp.]|nr:phenylalanine--tRNA ligase subunit beta [Candidatus Cardinium sp.]